MKKKTCTKKAPKETNNKGCMEGCNPFMGCCGCIYTIPERPEFDLTPPLPLVVKNGERPVNFSSTYISGVWHPPK